MSSTKKAIQLSVGEDGDVAYISLPDHPGDVAGVVERTLSPRDLVAGYSGPDINLDFTKDNVLIGIEIVD